MIARIPTNPNTISLATGCTNAIINTVKPLTAIMNDARYFNIVFIVYTFKLNKASKSIAPFSVKTPVKAIFPDNGAGLNQTAA